MLGKYFGDLRTQRDIHKSVLYKRRQSVQSTNSKTHLTTKQHGKFCQGLLKKLTEHSLEIHFLKLQPRRKLERTPEGPFWVYFLDHDLVWSQKNQINVFLIRGQTLSCTVPNNSFGFWPSLNTQSCIKGLLGVRDFCFWAVWAAGPVQKKRWGADYEQLLRVVFFIFSGAKKILNFFCPRKHEKTSLKSCS